MSLVIRIIEACLAVPAIRAFLEKALELLVLRLATEVVSELFTRTYVDAGFRARFMELSAQLKKAPTPEERQRVLAEINALRRG